MSCQLQFVLEERSEIEEIKDAVTVVKESSDKVRKSLFARHAALAKKYDELHDRMQIIERNICRGIS